MNTKPKTEARDWMEIPGICFMRKPDGVRRCTLWPDHPGDHKHVYSRELRGGVRLGTAWPRREGEWQAG
jgi:hypothetical protein